MKTKARIYTILADDGGVVSGETISEQLGISRVSVWKHIKAMMKEGIDISSSSKGYLLHIDPDNLNPLGCGLWRDRLHYFVETTSTMDEANQLARNGCPDFTVVVAETQTAGRGRMRRSWDSASGGLFFTVVVRPDVPVQQASLVNLAAAVEMNRLLIELYGIDSRLKWPNDILVGDRKICGILSQMSSEGDLVDYISIGIGLNVNNEPDLVEPRAVALKKLLGRPVDRKGILIGFLEAYQKRLSHFDGDEVIRAWKAHNVTIGRQVRVVTIREIYEGKAVDMNETGGLVLAFDDGSTKTVVHGDCFYQ